MICTKPDAKRGTLRRLLAAVALVGLLTAGGCRFLADEFTSLDRAGPVTAAPPASATEAPQ